MNKKASVLMVSLWILAILSVFAIGLGHRAYVNLQLARLQRDKLKASSLAKAGLNYAIELINNDSSAVTCDAIDECGIALGGKLAEEVFKKEWKNGLESFTIGYYDRNNNFVYGIRDEERSININAADTELLKQLFMARGLDADSQALSVFLSRWLTSEGETEEEKKVFKNAPLSIKEELLLPFEYFYPAKERILEAYNSLADSVTVYGQNRLNINTVDKNSLNAFIKSYATGAFDAATSDKLTNDLIAARDTSGPLDLQALENFGAGLSDPGQLNEANLFNLVKPNLIVKSEYYRIDCIGRAGKARQKITAVVRAGSEDGVIYWHEI